MSDKNFDKVPYQPSEAKRWEVASDKFSRERVEALKRTFDSLEEQLTYFPANGEKRAVGLGMSLGGSLSKGKRLDLQSAGKTDVDLNIFYDPEDAVELVGKIVESKPDGRLAKLYKELYRLHAGKIDYATSRGIPVNKEKILANAPLVASRGAVELLIKETINSFLESVDVGKTRDVKIGQIGFEGNDSIFNQIYEFYERGLEYISQRYNTRGGNPIEYQVASYFHLDVGGGMHKYIRSFLGQLSELDDLTRDQIWDFTRRCVEVVERDGNISETIRKQFPQTYQDACKYYGFDKMSS